MNPEQKIPIINEENISTDSPETEPVVENTEVFTGAEDLQNQEFEKKKAEVIVSDSNRVEEVRKSLGISSEETKEKEEGKKERRGWRVNLKPRAEWRKEKELETDHPLDRLKRLVKSFSKEEREKAEINKKNVESLNQDRSKYPEAGFTYKQGTGVEGMVGGEVGILAKGFFECSGLVIQTPDSVSVIHISPNTMNSPESGGEIVSDADYSGHIRSAFKKIVNNSPDNVEKTEGGTKLTEEELSKLQDMIDAGELKSTMLIGEDKFTPIVPMNLADQGLNLPYIKTDAYYVGATGGDQGYAIYATPEDVYFIGSNNEVMKKGVNFPPEMFEYK